VVESNIGQFKRQSNSQFIIGERMQSNQGSNAKEKRSASLKMVLNDQEKKIISLRFGLSDDNNRTLEQIGKNLGLTRERVRQIEKRALNKLKNHPTVGLMKSFLDD